MSLTRKSDTGLASEYLPILRGYFGATAVYYLIMLIVDLTTVRDASLYIWASAHALSALGLFTLFRWVKLPRTVGQLEVATFLANMILLGNVILGLSLIFSEVRLTYFLMTIMIYALTSLTLRQAIVSIACGFAAMGAFLWDVDMSTQATFGFLGFAATMSALTIAHVLRRIITKAIDARQLADEARNRAELDLEGQRTLGEKLRKRSLSDTLTGLANRRAFYVALDKSLAEQAGDTELYLALLDLDGFKTINDTFGHLTGDELLKAVAFRLRNYCGGRAHVSRMGGDEFSIIFETKMIDADPLEWCEGLLEQVAKSYMIDGRLVQVSGSIGCYGLSSEEAHADFMRKADFALLSAKKTGKNRVVFFDTDHALAEAERHRVEVALRKANLDEEISLVFQPQVDLGTGKMVRAEALARWDSPALGSVSPTRFVQVAEEAGLIADISVSVVRKAIEALAKWDNPVPLSINLSATDLASTQTMRNITQELINSDVDPTLIEFEVTESAMLTDEQRAREHIKKLSELGCSVAIDDFGTGYSNFSYLRALPIQKLKVDRSFMEDLGDPMTGKILHSLVGMAHTLGVQCVLEGVEDEVGMLMAKRAGADIVQGFLTGKPVNAEQLFDDKGADLPVVLPH